MNTISRARDGYYHPASENELQALVSLAHERRMQLRVRGSAHSAAPSIYTSGYAGKGPAPSTAIEVMLDRYTAVRITPDVGDPSHAIVEVEAGCHLGKDPHDPTGTSSWANSLNLQLQRAGYALDDLGGISHQTLAGFMSTGSSGGSLLYSFSSNIARIRFIDGSGVIHDVSGDDPDPERRDLFAAVGVSMGLLGVISKVWLRVGPSYNIQGSQVTSPTDQAPFDMFGGGGPGRLGIVEFLQKTPYARVMWWPQRGFERAQVWQAARLEPTPDFKPQPYLELGRSERTAALAGSLVYTILGNLDDISSVPGKLSAWYAALESDIGGDADPNADPSIAASRGRTRRDVGDVLKLIQQRLEGVIAGRLRAGGAARGALLRGAGATLAGPVGRWVAALLVQIVEAVLKRSFDGCAVRLLARLLKRELPEIIPYILDLFVTDGTQTFCDTWMSGLPMDNQMDDLLWPTDFTELWIPVERAPEALRALRGFYRGGGDSKVAFAHTGSFSCELYAATASPFWLSPSHERPSFRVDVLWFSPSAGDPRDAFYPPFWELLEPFAFRPHWGKDLPPATARWQRYLREVYPKLDAFLALRERLDPRDIFLTDYWRSHLGVGERRGANEGDAARSGER